MLEKTVVIFGSGIRGRKLLQDLRNEYIDVSYFCDNNEEKWGSYIDGIEVRKPNNVSLNDDHYIVIAIREAQGVREQILSLGVSEKNLVVREDLFCMNNIDYPNEVISDEVLLETRRKSQEDVDISYVFMGAEPKKYYADRIEEVSGNINYEIIPYNGGSLSELCHGENIIFLSADNYVQRGFVQKLLSMYKKYDSKCVVGSKVVDTKGQILSAGQIYWNDAVIENYLYGKKMSCCESDFVREVDGLTIDGLLLGREFLPLFSDCMQANNLVKFFVELHEQNVPVIYQPESIILKNESTYFQYRHISEYNMVPRNYFCYAKDCSRGRKHTLKNISFHKYKGYMLLVEGSVPRFDQTAAGRTIDQYIEIFQKLDMQVVLLASNYLKTQFYTQRYQQKGIFVIYGVEWHGNRKELLYQYLEDIKYAFFVWPHCSLEYINLVKEYDPNIVTSYYGGDIHYIRLKRQYELTNDVKFLEESQRVEKQEDDIINAVDYAGYPSYLEVEFLQKKFPERTIQYYPAFYYPDRELQIREATNKGLIFVGIFAHAPNTDGVLWFLQNVMPILKNYGYTDPVYIVGGMPTDEIIAYGDEQVIITGHVTDEELEHYYDISKVAIAPLRFGAGIKGKVLESLYRGVPMVTTDIGAESIEVESSGLVIANDAEAFAKKIWDLYRDDKMINECSRKGQKYAMDNFGENALKSLFQNQMAER